MKGVMREHTHASCTLDTEDFNLLRSHFKYSTNLVIIEIRGTVFSPLKL